MTALTRPYWIEAQFERREGWDDAVYPFNLPAVRTLHSLAFHPNVTFLVGENGSGKSTLIEALAVAWGFNAEGGGREHRFGTRESHSPLHRFVRPVKSPQRLQDGFFLRAESFFTTASYLEAAGGSRYGGASLHEQSHGESFFALFENRFIGDGLYILGYPNAWIYQVSEHGVDRIEYEDTDHYQVTRNFLTRRDMMLDILLSDD